MKLTCSNSFFLSAKSFPSKIVEAVGLSAGSGEINQRIIEAYYKALIFSEQ